MKRLEFKFNKEAFDAQMNIVTQAEAAFGDLLKEFADLNLFKINSIQDLAKLVNDPEPFIKDWVGNQMPPQSFGIFKLKKQAAIDMLDLPDFSKTKELAKECLQYLNRINYLTIRNNSLSRNEKAIEDLRESCYILATTNEEAQVHEAITQTTKGIEALYIALRAKPMPYKRLLFSGNNSNNERSPV